MAKIIVLKEIEVPEGDYCFLNNRPEICINLDPYTLNWVEPQCDHGFCCLEKDEVGLKKSPECKKLRVLK